MPPGATGGVVDAAFVGGEHPDEEAHDAGRSVDLVAVLALGAGELGEEVFKDAADDEINEFAEAVFVEIGAVVVFIERAFEAGAVAIEGTHGVVHILADAETSLGRGTGAAASGHLPAPRRHSRRGILLCPRSSRRRNRHQRRRVCPGVLRKTVGDEFTEDQAKNDVVDGLLRVRPGGCLRQSVSLRSRVFRCVHVVPQLVSGKPELGFVAEGITGGGGFGGFS